MNVFFFLNLINLFVYVQYKQYYGHICIDVQYQHIFCTPQKQKLKIKKKMEQTDLLGILFQRYHYYDVHAKVK